MPTRPEMLSRLTPTGLDLYAAELGFQGGGAALATVIRVAAKVRAGHQLTQHDAAQMQRVFPHTPPHVIEAYRNHINAEQTPQQRFASFCASCSIDPARAGSVVTQYEHLSAAAAVEAKLAARDAAADRRRGVTDAERAVAKAKHAAAEPDTMRADIERAMRLWNAPGSTVDTRTARQRRLQLADQIDNNVRYQLAVQNRYERERKEGNPYAGDRARHHDIHAAWNYLENTERANAELDLAKDPVAERYSNDMAREDRAAEFVADHGGDSGSGGSAAAPASGSSSTPTPSTPQGG